MLSFTRVLRPCLSKQPSLHPPTHTTPLKDPIRFLPIQMIACPSSSSDQTTATVSGVFKFTILQFNILARNLATRTHFPYVADHSLEWKYRKHRLIQQLEQADPDVICLQELTDYWTFFKSELDKRGYDSVFINRPSVHVSNWSGTKKEDGCSIFFRKSLFELEDCDFVNYQDEHDRVGLLAKLKVKTLAQEQSVLIATTHLWWNSSKPTHQIAELMELEREVVIMRKKEKVKESIDNAAPSVKLLDASLSDPAQLLPLVFCGDFNNGPTSSVYEYMQNTFLQDHGERMRSAYDCYQLCTNTEAQGKPGPLAEPPHTTANFRRCWTIDYIWYSSSSLRATKLLPIPSEAELREEEGPDGWLALTMADDSSGRLPVGLQGNHNGIPNSKHGSDHVPIMCEVELLKMGSERS